MEGTHSLLGRASAVGLGFVLVTSLVLAGCAAGASPSPEPTGTAPPTATPGPSTPAPQGICDPEEIVFVNSIRSLANPYHAQWAEGGRMFAEAMGLEGNYQVLTNENDSQKQLSQIRAVLATNPECVVINVDPNTTADTIGIATAVVGAGGILVSQWAIPDGVYPWDFGDNWVTHWTFDGRVGGYQIAKALFEAMGGKGNIVALQGILDTVAEQQRFAGLEKALDEYPDITLLDAQLANWDTQQAFNVTKTWLTKYPDQIDGVWAANDSMGIGALEALRSVGLAGKVPIVGIDATKDALEAILRDEMIATVASNAYWQGSIAFAIGYKVLTGELKTSDLSHLQRLFYAKTVFIDKSSASTFLSPPDLATMQEWWADPFNNIEGPLTYPQGA